MVPPTPTTTPYAGSLLHEAIESGHLVPLYNDSWMRLSTDGRIGPLILGAAQEHAVHNAVDGIKGLPDLIVSEAMQGGGWGQGWSLQGSREERQHA